ncbi:MAG: type II 3-dehydroquinate dehydratase [Gammaproteobacteria bacterium]|nr:type II 3-dehydroquinate dehydratase [Gammaproteobacteria bacterium]
MRVAVIHGANLRMLGRREPEVYGSDTLEDINGHLRTLAEELGMEIEIFQSNSEGAILDYLEEAAPRVDGVLINPGAFTHTSIALRDALAGIDKPFVEVHLSNPAARESFRHRSYLAPVAAGVVAGFRAESYLLALRGLLAHLSRD